MTDTRYIQSGALPALEKVAGLTGHQAACSLLLVSGAVLFALRLQAYTWMALFGAMLLPLMVTSAGLLLLLKLHMRAGFHLRWRWIWAVMLVLLPVSSAAATWAYRAWLSRYEVHGLNNIQAFTCAFCFVLMVLALPLWIAQGQARATHLSNLTQAALASDLKALQAQIEPHFLYNTLANTRYLTRHDPVRAVEMLDHLIAYLHSALPDLRSPTSTLKREFELAEHYLALMAIRFGERLRIQLDLPRELGSAQLAPLMLMPLVENAVQHGVEPQSGDVTVSLCARLEGKQLIVTVRDNGAGLGNVVLGSGVGLRNVRQRLAGLYGEGASTALRAGADGWTEAELSIPMSAASVLPSDSDANQIVPT